MTFWETDFNIDVAYQAVLIHIHIGENNFSLPRAQAWKNLIEYDKVNRIALQKKIPKTKFLNKDNSKYKFETYDSGSNV